MSRVSNQNGVSLLYIMLEIHHSGWEPSNCVLYFCICTCSVQLSMFYMERRSRNMLITIIFTITAQDIQEYCITSSQGQTCLPLVTSVSSPNSLFLCFQIFDQLFVDAPPSTNHKKKVSKANFSGIHLVRRVCKLTFSIIQTHYKTGALRHFSAFILFTSAQVVLVKDCRTLSPTAMHHVYSFC